MIPLLAFLLLFLLPSDVSCQKLAREENGEHEIKHYRKRTAAAKVAHYFTGANLKKVCSICHHKYDINAGNCMDGKREAKYKCMLIAKDNQKFFESQMAAKAPLRNEQQVKRSASLATLFEGENLKKVCAICQTDYNIDETDCINGNQKAKFSCMQTVRKNRMNFESKLSGSAPPPPPPPLHARGATVPSGDEFFAPENLSKTCKICKIFKVDIAACIASDGEARKHCKNMVAEMPNTVAKQWKKRPAKENKFRSIGRRSAALTADDFKGQNREVICDICHLYYGIDDADCTEDRKMARDECRKRVKENPDQFDFNWKKSMSPAVDLETVDLGTKENTEKICHHCEEQLDLNFNECVSARNGAQQKCRKWIQDAEKEIEKALPKQFNASDSIAAERLWNSKMFQERQKVRT